MAAAVALLLGGSLGLLAGARRSSSALDRVLSEYGAEDLFLVYPEDGSLDPGAVHALPQVRSAEHQSYIGMVPIGEDGRPQTDLVGAINPYLYVPITASARRNRLHIVAGRDLDRTQALEVVIDVETSAAYHLDVGDRLPMQAYAASQADAAFSSEPGARIPDPEGPVLDLEVVGITRMPVDIHPTEEHTTSFGGTKDIYLTPALYERFGGQMLVYNPPIEGGPEALRLVHGPADLDAFTAALRDLPGGEGALVEASDSDTLDSARQVRRAIAVETAVLYALAAALATSGVALVAFAMLGTARAQTEEMRVLRAVGLPWAGLLEVAASPAALAAGIGAIGAVVIAIAMSTRMPIGLARQAEAHGGVDVDLVVLLGGTSAILVAGLGGALLASYPTVRSLGEPSQGRRAGRPLADLLARAGAPLAPTLGASFIGRVRSAPRGAPVRSAVASGAIAIAAIAGVAVYTSTLSHLAGSSTEQGAGWAIALGNINLADYSKDEMARLEAVPGVEGVTAAAAPQGRGAVEDIDVAIAGIEQASGDVGPTLVSGRLPRADGEVALGRHTAARLGVHEGDEVEVRAGPEGAASATVVGIVLLNANISPTMQLGDGALVSVHQLQAMIPDQPVTFLLAGVEDGAEVDEVIASINESWGDSANAARPLLSGDVVNLRRVGYLPTGLAMGLGVAALVLLVFALVLSTRQRRKDLAVLRALGATRGQSTAALAWQGMWMAGAAAALGAPLGIVAGRVVWRRLADGLGAITDPVVPWTRELVIVVMAVGLAGAIAAVPAAVVGHRRPGSALRVE